MALASAAPSLFAADYTAPCEIPCGTQAELTANWTIVDHNNDGAGDETTWAYSASDNAAVYSYHRSNAADDWLIAKVPVELKAGETYKVTGDIKTYNNNTEESIAFYAATADNIEALLQNKFYFDEKLASNSYDWRGGSFAPAADGKYYFAIQCYSIKNRWKVYFRGLQIEIVKPHPLAATDVTAKAASQGELKATVSWTMPTKLDNDAELTSISGAKIYRGTSSYFSLNSSTFVGTYTDGTPGAVCSWDDTTLEKAGQYYYAVVPFDENGDSQKSPEKVQSDWIGNDTGVKSITNVVAVLTEGSDSEVTITWEVPLGSNGGYINPADLMYKITRKAVSTGSTSTTLSETVTTNSYVDNTIDGLDSYTYTVYSVYKGSTAWSGTNSNSVNAGGALNPPYTQGFSSTTEMALWTLFHGESATRDWGISSSKLNYWGTPADAWAVTPAINLKADTPYELTFTDYVNTTSSPKTLYVYIGTEATAENLCSTQLFKTVVNWKLAKSEKIIVNVPTDGRYYIALRCYGESDSNDLYVDNFSLKETIFTPAAIDDLSAEVGEKGTMTVTLNWTNPTKTNAGTELTELTKVEVLRGSEVIATLTEENWGASMAAAEVEAGKCTYTDNTLSESGKYTYSVKPYLGENAGEATSVTTSWVGPDTPVAPTSVTAEVKEDGRIITFEAIGEGINGGYIDPEALHYELTRNGETIASDVTASPYTDNATELPLGKYIYGVKAVCNGLESAEVKAKAIVFGEALELPYEADFTSNGDLDLWTMTGDGSSWDKNNSNTWTGSIHSRYVADNAWAFTPPVKLVHSNLKLSYTSPKFFSNDIEQPLEVYISKSTDHTNAEHHTLIDSRTITSDKEADNNHTAEFTVYHPGTYYVAYRIPTNKTRIDIKSTKLEATQILTGVEDVAAEGEGKLMYSRSFDFIQAPEGAEVSVFNAAGVLVLRAEAVDGQVDTSALASGLYVASASASGERLTLKFAK